MELLFLSLTVLGILMLTLCLEEDILSTLYVVGVSWACYYISKLSNNPFRDLLLLFLVIKNS